MKLRDQAKLALRALMERKLRSSLTLLGIVVGVILLAAVFVVADSVSATVEEALVKGGANQVYVIASKRYVTPSDRLTLSSIPHVAATVAYASYTPARVSFEGVAVEDASLILVEPDGLQHLYPGLKASKGVVELGAMECLVGQRLAEKLGGALSCGDVIQASAMGVQASLRVAGILERYGFTFTGHVDRSVVASIDLIQRRGALRQYPFVLVMVDDPSHVEEAVDLIKDLFGGSFNLFVVKDIVKQVVSAMEGVSLIVGGIASVTLVVAAVGLMNAMFTAVAERTRIIGVLRALGVRRGGIMSLLIIEAIALAALGLAIGLPLGLAAGTMLASQPGLLMGGAGAMGGIRTVVTIKPHHLAIVAAAPLLLSIVGVLPPAYRASRLEPAQALRQE
jgi:putative ABC transport system permease protein